MSEEIKNTEKIKQEPTGELPEQDLDNIAGGITGGCIPPVGRPPIKPPTGLPPNFPGL
jgi:hypothetical protein